MSRRSPRCGCGHHSETVQEGGERDGGHLEDVADRREMFRWLDAPEGDVAKLSPPDARKPQRSVISGADLGAPTGLNFAQRLNVNVRFFGSLVDTRAYLCTGPLAYKDV